MSQRGGRGGPSHLPGPSRRREDEDLQGFVNKRVADYGPPAIRTYASSRPPRGRGADRGSHGRGRGRGTRGGKPPAGRSPPREAPTRPRQRDPPREIRDERDGRDERDRGGRGESGASGARANRDERDRRERDEGDDADSRWRPSWDPKRASDLPAKPSWAARPRERDEDMERWGDQRDRRRDWYERDVDDRDVAGPSRPYRAYTPSRPIFETYHDPRREREPSPIPIPPPSIPNKVDSSPNREILKEESFSYELPPQPGLGQSRVPPNDRPTAPVAPDSAGARRPAPHETVSGPSRLASASASPLFLDRPSSSHEPEFQSSSRAHVGQPPSRPSPPARPGAELAVTSVAKAAQPQPLPITKLKFKPTKKVKGKEPSRAGSGSGSAVNVNGSTTIPAAGRIDEKLDELDVDVDVDVKPTLEELEQSHAQDQVRSFVDDLSRLEGTSAFVKSDVPSGCYSSNRTTRDRSRALFKSEQAVALREQGRQLKNSKWRDDGVAFDWEKRIPPTTAPLHSNPPSAPGSSAPHMHAGQRKSSHVSIVDTAAAHQPDEANPTPSASGSKTKKNPSNGKAKKLVPAPEVGEEETLNDIVVSEPVEPISGETSKSAKKKKRKMEKEEALADAQIAEPTPKKKTKVKNSEAEAGDAVQTPAPVIAPSTTAPPTPRASLTPKTATTALPPDPPLVPVSTRPPNDPTPSASAHNPVAGSSESTSDQLTRLEISLDAKFTAIDRWMSIQQQYPERTNVVKKQIERMQGEIFDLQEEIEQVKRSG